MPTDIDTSLVDKQLRAIRSISDGFRKLLLAKFEAISQNPACCEPLEDLPPDLGEYRGLTLRKAKITGFHHDWRMIYAHWTNPEGHQHVDILFLFDRRKGYPTLADLGEMMRQNFDPDEDAP